MKRSVSKPMAGALERTMESALRPGTFIDYNAGWSFVTRLEEVATQIAALIGHGNGDRAVSLYELFIVGCYEKAEELDDSSGGFGMFVESLFGYWIQARETAGMDSHDTVATLLTWVADDPYGFCAHIERPTITAFTPKGLLALAEAVRARLDATMTAEGTPTTIETRYQQRRWLEILKAFYAAQHDVEAYLSVCTTGTLTPSDCVTVADLYKHRGDPATALEWIERGLQFDLRKRGGADFDLRRRQRALLRLLGRADEAQTLAWQEFTAAPSTFSYHTLMEAVAESDRAEWHAKAMTTADGGSLYAVIPLWVETRELERLVTRLQQVEDAELEALSHVALEPAATQLALSHPAVAARLYRALGLRILKAKKSKYYDTAVGHFAHAKACYTKAGLHPEWLTLVEAIRRAHGRKYGFMPAFERVVAGQPPPTEVSFLERAQQRWRWPGRS